jgi:hypothetical protein
MRGLMHRHKLQRLSNGTEGQPNLRIEAELASNCPCGRNARQPSATPASHVQYNCARVKEVPVDWAWTGPWKLSRALEYDPRWHSKIRDRRGDSLTSIVAGSQASSIGGCSRPCALPSFAIVCITAVSGTTLSVFKWQHLWLFDAAGGLRGICVRVCYKVGA